MPTKWLTGGPKTEGTSIRVTGSPATLDFIRNGSRRHMVATNRIAKHHARAATEEATRLLRDRTRELTPRQSGAARASIHDTVRVDGDGYVGNVTSDSKVVKVLEEGSGVFGPTHRPILPKPPHQFLRFPDRRTGAFRLRGDVPRIVGGKLSPAIAYVYAKSVQGQKAHHMFSRAAKIERIPVARIYGRHAAIAAAEIRALLR